MKGGLCANFAARVKSNDDWLAHSHYLYREQQRRDGQFAREIREMYALSLREVARRMKVSAMFLSDLERGNRNWRSEHIAAWTAAILGSGLF